MTRIKGILGVITVFILNSLFPSNNKLKFVFNEKPPLLNITLSPVKLSNFWTVWLEPILSKIEKFVG